MAHNFMPLTPDILLSAYRAGIFPMGVEDALHPPGTVLWYDPNPRAILPLEAFHVSHSLQRTLKKGVFELRINSAFTEVMHRCARGFHQAGDWISPTIIEAYTNLHELGYAHSVESWRDGQLVGGLYGVAVQGLFAGESMFSLERDASKVALVHLVQRLQRQGFVLLDIQYMTAHLRQFGARNISRQQYKARLAAALQLTCTFL